MKKETCAKFMGRPRAFDPEHALAAAINIFWQRGYEGTSLSDLTKAMGINRPSLYATFGNKEELYRRALGEYEQRVATGVADALDAPTARASVQRLLDMMVPGITDPEHPGCFNLNGALACSQANEGVKEMLCTRRQTTLNALTVRFVRAAAEGDPTLPGDPHDAARMVITFLHGMSVQATTGATREELARAAKLFIAGWPKEPVSPK
jgi:AcrR family transcriptional regulator